MLNLYVFEGVLTDYTDGIAMIAAETLEQAQDFARAEFSSCKTVAAFLAHRAVGGFEAPAAVYWAVGGAEPGVRHFVYGGA